MGRWRMLSLAAVAAAVSVAALFALRTTASVQVMTAPVTSGAIVRQIVATGTLQPMTVVQVGVQVSGMVQSLGADFNSVVHAGQIVARLDPSLYEAQLLQAKAALTQAEADINRARTGVEDARMKLTRAEALAAKTLIPQSDLDAARIAMDEANAALGAAISTARLAKANVDQAQSNVDYTVVRSPIDGVVIERDVDVGQTLAASMQSPLLFKIAADLRHMQVQVDIDEADVGGILPGEPASFVVDSYPDAVFHGTVTVTRLQPVAEQTTTGTTTATSTSPAQTTVITTVVSYTTIVDVDNRDERLWPGMTAEVTLAGARRDRAVRIPNNALSFRPPADILAALGESEPPADDSARDDSAQGRRRQVWRYDGKKIQPITVRSGLADQGWTEQLSGSLRPGDTLVTGAVLQRHRKM